MDFDASIGESHIFRLQKAVLLYGSTPAQCTFATVHDVRFKDGEVVPSLGEAQLLRVEFLRELVKSLTANSPIEVLPENVLVRNELTTVWWRPAQRKTMFFHLETPLGVVNAQKFPIPSLVFRVAAGSLAVRALVENVRPVADTGLFLAPFWNVFEDGRVCHGSMRAPDDPSMKALDLWEKAFFGSNFTHTIRDAICTHPGGATGLWTELAGKAGTFPQHYLKAANQTLQEFIANGH